MTTLADLHAAYERTTDPTEARALARQINDAMIERQATLIKQARQDTMRHVADDPCFADDYEDWQRTRGPDLPDRQW